MTCDTATAHGDTAHVAKAQAASATALLAFATFVIVTTEFIVVGLLPAMARDLAVSLDQAGRTVTWFALAAAIGGPPMTMLAARSEPKLVVIVTVTIIAVGNLALMLVPRYETLVMARIVQGCALTVFISVAAVAAARLAGPLREGRAIARVNTGVVAATVLGVPAGAVIADQASWHASFGVLTAFGLISVVSIVIFFPRTGIATPASGAGTAALRRPAFVTDLVLSGVLFTGMFAGYTFIAALLGSAGFGGTTVGWMLVGFGLAGVFGNAIAGYAADRDALAATVVVALALAAAMATIAIVTSMPVLLIGVVAAWGTAHMAAFVVSQVRTMQAGRAAPAFAMSLNIAVCNLGIALGAVFGGRIADAHGVTNTGYGGAAIATVAALIAIAMVTTRSRPGGVATPPEPQT